MRFKNAYQFLEKGYAEYFSLDEWPIPEDLQYVHYKVIEGLDELREAFGHPIYPSQNPDGLVRFDGSRTSRHYVGDGGWGLAVDVFPSVNVLDCWLKAIEMPQWYGIGVYLDTQHLPLQPQPMLHLDIDDSRGFRAFWVRNSGEYIKKHRDPQKFWNYLAKASER